MIVGVCGKRQSGKSTVSKIICERLGSDAVSMSFARMVKIISGIIFNVPDVFTNEAKSVVLSEYNVEWLRERFETPELFAFKRAVGSFERFKTAFEQLDWDRYIHTDHITFGYSLQLIGTEVGRDRIHSDIWIDVLKYNMLNCQTKFIVIDDVRFENEAQWCDTVIKVERPDTTSQYIDGRDSNHASETLNIKRISRIICNDDTMEVLCMTANRIAFELSVLYSHDYDMTSIR